MSEPGDSFVEVLAKITPERNSVEGCGVIAANRITAGASLMPRGVFSSPVSDMGEQTLVDLPPSAKLVFWVIDHEGPVTQQQIAEETLLSKRTVRYGIKKLTEINAITEQRNLTDARQTLYTADTAPSTGAS